jgi:pimeloyl-ACP methyl ester carboxylesterase
MTGSGARAKVERLYRGVPAGQRERLRRFRERITEKTLVHDGVTWSYLDTGQGPEVVLALAGAGCIAEIGWKTIERLAKRFRVIAPDYPAIDSNAALVDGLAAVLDREGLSRAHLLGGSYGGLVAQVFVRRHPGRTASLILSHTLLPDPATGQAMARLRRWVRLLPWALLKAVFLRSMLRLMPSVDGPEAALIRAHFLELVHFRLTRAQVLSLMARTAELGERFSFTPSDLDGWTGKILLLMAEDDPATPEPLRRAMTAMYPRAQVHLFSGAGHLTAVVKEDEYLGAIETFLEEQGAEASFGSG